MALPSCSSCWQAAREDSWPSLVQGRHGGHLVKDSGCWHQGLWCKDVRWFHVLFLSPLAAVVAGSAANVG
eukprot:12894297-Prorocentrum_lima.AAC.1